VSAKREGKGDYKEHQREEQMSGKGDGSSKSRIKGGQTSTPEVAL